MGANRRWNEEGVPVLSPAQWQLAVVGSVRGSARWERGVRPDVDSDEAQGRLHAAVPVAWWLPTVLCWQRRILPQVRH